MRSRFYLLAGLLALMASPAMACYDPSCNPPPPPPPVEEPPPPPPPPPPPEEPPLEPPTQPQPPEDHDREPPPLSHPAPWFAYCCIDQDDRLQRIAKTPLHLFKPLSHRQCKAKPLTTLKVCTDWQMGY